MSVHPTNPTPVKAPGFKKVQNLLVFEQMSLGQRLQHTQNLAALLQRTACQLTDNERMAEDLPIKQQSF
jgi:hypothetical protein